MSIFFINDDDGYDLMHFSTPIQRGRRVSLFEKLFISRAVQWKEKQKEKMNSELILYSYTLIINQRFTVLYDGIMSCFFF